MCVSIMKGFVLFFPKEEDIEALKEDIDDSPSVNFLVSSLKTQILIQSKRWEDALSELSSTIDFMNNVTPENNPEVIYGIMLSALAIYSILEKDESNGSYGTSDTSFRKISLRSKRRISSSTTISPRNTNSSKREEFGLHMLAGKMLKILSEMPCNFLLQKVSILIRTLVKHSDLLLRTYNWNIMKEEAKRLSQDNTKCKYLAIVFLIKSSKLYGKSEDGHSRLLAEKLCEKSRIETCLNIL